MQSLRDKLLKAGLVSEDAAKKAEIEKNTKAERPAAPRQSRGDERRPASGPPSGERGRPPAYRGPPPARREEPVASRIPKLPPLQGSKEAHRQQAKKQQQLDRQLRELVLANQVGTDIGATPFYFVTRKNKLRRLELKEEQAKMLERGELAVVERPDPDKIEHALVPPAIAEQMIALSPKSVRFLNKEGAKVGFLSDAEIHARASEADAPSDDTREPTTAELTDEAAPPAATTEEPKPAEPETFITIKRAPRE